MSLCWSFQATLFEVEGKKKATTKSWSQNTRNSVFLGFNQMSNTSILIINVITENQWKLIIFHQRIDIKTIKQNNVETMYV